MSEPFVGRRVEITGTSRADLNGKRGTAINFDTDKGRYRVRVRGSDMYLKPSNLLPVPETGAQASPPSSDSFLATPYSARESH